ncbi:hypothetical protein NH8B_1807 [Pseudogulbenkiania sp. NH8B]|nr:hypothetical protein NH8B_1807 [Pseudogulbenkiania sp. NH8B]
MALAFSEAAYAGVQQVFCQVADVAVVLLHDGVPRVDGGWVGTTCGRTPSIVTARLCHKLTVERVSIRNGASANL